MKKNVFTFNRPNKTAVWVAAGTFAAAAACNIWSAVSEQYSAGRAAVQTAILFLILSAAILANGFAGKPSYPRFLRDAAIAAAVLAALSGSLYVMRLWSRTYTGGAAAYAFGTTIGLAPLAVISRVLEKKRNMQWD